MTTSERDAAWREYAHQLGRLNVIGESLESAEFDFKAGFDAARRVIARLDTSAAPASKVHHVANARS